MGQINLFGSELGCYGAGFDCLGAKLTCLGAVFGLVCAESASWMSKRVFLGAKLDCVGV